MLRVKVRYYLIFFLAVGSRLEEIICIEEGSTIENLLTELVERYGNELARRLWDGDGKLRSSAWILVNGVCWAEGTTSDMELKDGDTVVLTTPMLVGG